MSTKDTFKTINNCDWEEYSHIQALEEKRSREYPEVITPAKVRGLHELTTDEKREFLIDALLAVNITKTEIAKIFKISRQSLWEIKRKAKKRMCK